jgi:hypothetical protein
MKTLYVILSIVCMVGLIITYINIETIKDIGLLIVWATGLLINHINFRHEP